MLFMRLAASLVALSLCALPWADPVDDLVNRAVAAGTPGIAIAVIKDSKIERLKGYGFADVENRVKATPDSMFQIGSVTKQFTATLIMMLVEEGKVVLDAPISTYLPDLPETWQAATVRQMLNHTSGIPSYTGLPAFWDKMATPGTDKALIEIAAAVPNPYKHGEKWSYNNTAYYLLGMLVEKVAGKPFETMLRERICSPVGMASTRVNTWRAIIPHRARGYEGTGANLRNAAYLDMAWPGAGGHMVSNVRDLASWLLAQGSAKLLKPTSWTTMTSNGIPTGDGDTYGFGWNLNKINVLEVIEHGGGIPGFGSYVLRVPDKKFAVAVLTNSDDANPKALAYRIAEHFHGDLKPKIQAIPDPSPDLTKRLKAILEEALKGNMNEADFGDPLKSRIFPNNADMLRQMLGANAKLSSLALVVAQKTGQTEMRQYVAMIGDYRLKLTFQVDEGGKIVGMLVQND